jgi:serine protease Do
MISEKSLHRRGSLYILLIFITSLIIFTFTGIQSATHARASVISDESVEFLTNTGKAMAELAEAVKPAIVNISTTRTEKISESQFAPFFNDPLFRKFFGDRYGDKRFHKERKTASLGSGVIVSSDGYILTNNHVIKNADEIKVLLSDKREFKGEIIGSDPKTDIAVIKIEATDLPPVTWGDSDNLKVGEIVLAIGSPYGLNQTVTMGIVSAVERINMGIADYVDFIQTDAAINPGNSGGALVNAGGELVGINTAIFSTSGGYQGIGFAIPSNMAINVMESLITKGKVVRGWLGVSIQPISPELAQQFQLESEKGSLVGDVIEGSPAQKGGIMRGDVIIGINGEKVTEPHDLRNIIADTLPGESVIITVIRDSSEIILSVTLTELSAEPQEESSAEKIFNNSLRGVTVQDLTPEIYKRLDVPGKIRGVVITGIEPGTPAELKLMPGDVILEIKRKAITGTDDYERIVSGIAPDENILILIFRRGSSIFVTIDGEIAEEE